MATTEQTVRVNMNISSRFELGKFLHDLRKVGQEDKGN